MGKVDVVTKEYMQNNAVFADAFNYFIYGGKQVIQPEKLHEMDPEEILSLFDQENQKAVEKARDLLKKTTFMSDDKAAYLIMGIENESKIRYAEPVKSGLYDFLRYAAQVRQTEKRHRNEKGWKGHNSGEFLSGFYKEDKLIPVITLVILYGSEKWDGPRTLQEMMSIQDPEIQKYVADYQINLIEPAAMGEEDLAKFQSDLGSVLGFIKYANDEAALNNLLSNDTSLKRLGTEAAQVIRVCTNTKIEIDDGEEEIDVCKAVDQMTERARQEGLRTGKSEGRLETLRNAVKSIMKSLDMSMDDALKVLNVTGEDQILLKEMV